MTNTIEQNTVKNEHVSDSPASEESTAAETSSVSHEVTLYAEPVFHIGTFTVTNSLLNSWLTVFLIVIVSIVISRSIRRIPRGIQNFFEYVIEGALKMADSVTNSRKKSEKIFPIVFSIFLFVLVNNWLGLLPGIGSIGFIEYGAHGAVFVPLFRGATADLNTTLALALFAVFGANIFGVVSVGVWNYINKFINLKALGQIPGKIKKEPTVVLVNPITFFVGIIEIIGEIAKVASLAFRLFGNIFAGEVLLSSLAVIFAFVLPIPFMFLEIIVGIIQALIFSMLTLVYFTVAAESHDDHEEHAAADAH